MHNTDLVNEVTQLRNSGLSFRTIAAHLNREGIPGPFGRRWSDTTIRGHVSRGNGILNNELYIGRLVWNRLRYVKNPSTGKRVSRLNPESEWIVTEVPELRIVSDELWQAAKAKQAELTDKYTNVIAAVRKHHGTNRLNGTHRPKSLLSGLIFCGFCGGPYSLRGQARFAWITGGTKHQPPRDVTDADLRVVVRECPDVRLLVASVTLNAQMAATVSQLRQLEVLNVDRIEVTPEVIGPLQSLPRLTHVVVDVLADEERDLISRSLPGCEFVRRRVPVRML
jgi:hypothetical protein